MRNKTNAEIRKEARRTLEGQWDKAIWAIVIYAVITTAISALSYIPTPFFQSKGTQIALVVMALLLLPLGWGVQVFSLRMLRKEQLTLGAIFDGYKEFGRIFITTLLEGLMEFLFTLLLIIPGLIKGYAYAMVPYVLKDSPDISRMMALIESERLMKGFKLKLFLLHLSFIGWAILCCLTFGFGLILLLPYIYMTQAVFYEDIKAADRERYPNFYPADNASSTPEATV